MTRGDLLGHVDVVRRVDVGRVREHGDEDEADGDRKHVQGQGDQHGGAA